MFSRNRKRQAAGWNHFSTFVECRISWFAEELGSAYGYIRYADDLVVCASSREKIEEAQTGISQWLQVRGLALHPEKT